MGFFKPGDASPAYVLNRDSPFRSDVRTFLDEQWSSFEPVCGDDHFLSDSRTHFAQRVWELMLFGVLSEHGAELDPTKGDGPDFCLRRHDSKRVWVEAVAPHEGTGKDMAKRHFTSTRKTQRGSYGTYRLDRDKMVLRFASALRDKASLTKEDPKSQYRRHVKREVLPESDAYVVAINGGAIPDSDLASDIPTIVRTLFPIGEAQLVISVEGEPTRVEYPYRGHVSKAGGAEVNTTAFVGDEYVNVSAVIFCPYGVENAADTGGRSYSVVHNPRARVPLPRGFFSFGVEYWSESYRDGGWQLEFADHRRPKDVRKAWNTPHACQARCGVVVRKGRRDRRPIHELRTGEHVTAINRRGRLVEIWFNDHCGKTGIGWVRKKYLRRR